MPLVKSPKPPVHSHCLMLPSRGAVSDENRHCIRTDCALRYCCPGLHVCCPGSDHEKPRARCQLSAASGLYWMVTDKGSPLNPYASIQHLLHEIQQPRNCGETSRLPRKVSWRGFVLRKTFLHKWKPGFALKTLTLSTGRWGALGSVVQFYHPCCVLCILPSPKGFI